MDEYDPSLISTLQIAIMEQGLVLRELQDRIIHLEKALQNHRNTIDAHKI